VYGISSSSSTAAATTPFTGACRKGKKHTSKKHTDSIKNAQFSYRLVGELDS